MNGFLLNRAMLCLACCIPLAYAEAQTATQTQTNRTRLESPPELGQSWTGGTHLKPTGRISGDRLRIRHLLGADVKDSRGERLGSIEDFVVDPSSGEIEFAVITLSAARSAESASSRAPVDSDSATGSLAGPDSSELQTNVPAVKPGRIVPVPWPLLQPVSTQAVRRDSGGERHFHFTANVERDKLVQAPSIEPSHWVEINRPEWRRYVNTYYGISPGTSAGGGEAPTGKQSGAGQPIQPPTNRAPDAGWPE